MAPNGATYVGYSSWPMTPACAVACDGSQPPAMGSQMRQLRPLLLVVLCAVGLLVTTALPANAILNGEPDGDQHPYVAIVYNNSLYCSGAAISSTVVLTAAHCLGSNNEFYVSFDENPQPRYSNNWPHPDAADATGTGMSIGDFCGAASQSCPPGLIGFFASSDVAVVVLDTAIDLPRFAQLPAVGQVGQLSTNQQLMAVGYGIDSAVRGGGPPRTVASARRLTAPMTLLPTNKPIEDVTVRARSAGKVSPCYGDSGGPLLLGDTVLGVLSGGPGGLCSSHMYYSRIDLPQILDALEQLN